MAELISICLYLIIIASMTYVSKYAFHSRKKHLRQIGKLTMAVCPALVAAFRGTTGTDTGMYVNSYYHLQKVASERSNGFEVGYGFLIEVFNYLGAPHEAFLFFMSFITILFFLMFIEKEKDYIDVRFSCFLFFINLYMFSLNAMRQCVAITMGLYAYSLYREKKYVRYVAITLLASTIHVTGLMGLAVAVCDVFFKGKHYKGLTFISVLLGGILIFNRTALVDIMTNLTNADYAAYIAADFGATGSIVSFAAKNIIPLFFLTVTFLSIQKTDARRICYVLTYAGYVLTMLCLITGTQADRIGYNFQTLNILTLSHALVSKTWFYCGKRKIVLEKQSKKVILYVFFFLLYSFNWFYKRFGGLVPYAPFV